MHFVTIRGFNDHKTSTKHVAPMVDIKCCCGRKYSFVSHYLSHLENNTCSSGMTRKKLNAIVFHSDTDRQITLAEFADRVDMSCITESSGASIMPADSASAKELSLESLSLDSSCIHVERHDIGTPDCSDTNSMASSESGVFLKPDSSHYASTDFEFIATPSASDTASTVSDGGVVLTPPASTSSTSSGDIVYTHTGSTASGGNAMTTISGSSSSADILTPDTASLVGGHFQASDHSDLGEWAFLGASRVFTPASTSIDSSVSTVRFDANSKKWSCSKCDRTFAEEAHLRQHLNSAAHGPEMFHCPTADPEVTLAHLQDRKFKSISGLVSHIKRGSCNRGLDALKTIMEVMEKPMQKKMKASITPLDK